MDRYRNIMDESCNRTDFVGIAKLLVISMQLVNKVYVIESFCYYFLSIILSTLQLPFIDFTLIMQRWQRAQAEGSIEKLGGVTVDEGTSQPIPKLLPLSIATLRGSHKLAHID